MVRAGRICLALLAPLFLTSCLLTPGRFVSTLDIRKDRSFTFTYAGEVVLLDPASEIGSTPPEVAEGEQAEAPPPPPAPAEPKADTPKQVSDRRAMAEALMKEEGYRSAEYLGQGKFRIDYAVTGTLDRGFIYPFNTDAAAVFPWIAIEVRKDRTARIRALAFGEGSTNAAASMPLPNPSDSPAKERAGTFTLTTDAELVMQNNEEGVAAGPGTRVAWTITPTTKTVPTAVVRFAQ